MKTARVALCLLTLLGIAACTQSTPPMVNSRPLVVTDETVIDQIPLNAINDATLSALAGQYTKSSSGEPLDLTMTFNPSSRTYTQNSATNTLAQVETVLRRKGVGNLRSQTMAVPNGDPVLIITYDALSALPPPGCPDTPGLYDYQTSRFIGDYPFGCGVETMFAKQITDPSDLLGVEGLSQREGRRAFNVVDPYAAGIPREPLTGVETNELVGN
jgi:type IV pilus biogenesis protein CpaD/CtpE